MTGRSDWRKVSASHRRSMRKLQHALDRRKRGSSRRGYGRSVATLGHYPAASASGRRDMKREHLDDPGQRSQKMMDGRYAPAGSL